jgi:hypothetical protein
MQFPTEDELDEFPVVNDFSVTMREMPDTGRHIEFSSGSRGPLAWFPAWDHADRDLRHFVASDVPMGTLDEPFDDADDGWRLMLFEHAGWVYVLEGDSPHAEEFPRFFRVKRDQYLEAWAFVIDAYNPITPLDETDAEA